MKSSFFARVAFFVTGLVAAVLGLLPWQQAVAQEGRDFPLGPIGGNFRVSGNSSLAKISSITSGEPGAVAGLQAGDFIYGAFGQTFTPTGGDHYGVTQELGFAVDRAEGGDGILPLLIMRPGTGGMTVNVTLPAAGAFGPAYPRNSPKYAAFYETAVADLHTRAVNSNGSMGYMTGFTGLCLLGHPNWNDTTGAKPYRLSINKIRDHAINAINSWGYAPTEGKLVDGSAIPNPSGGPSNWELGQLVMFLSEYYAKTADSTVTTPLQRGTEMCGNTVQWWKQPSETGENGFQPEYDRVAGMSSHGGVTGDYMHHGWTCGINAAGVHNLNGLAFARSAGVNMDVRPKDGHYFGFNVNPGDPIPAGVANALPSSITLPKYAADPVRGLVIQNTSSPLNRSDASDPFFYNPSLAQKFLMQMNFICRRSMSNGNVRYSPEAGDDPDSMRTSGALLGMALYQRDVGGLDSADLNRMESMKQRISSNYMAQQNSHILCMFSGQAFQSFCTPFLSDRQQRFSLDNWRFYYALSRTSDNGYRYFQARNGEDAGAYLNNNHCASINIALPYGIANGRYLLIPGYNTNRTLANFKSPFLMWPTIAARTGKVTTSTQAFEIDVCDGDGNVLAPGSYTATWSHVSGPATATFSSNNTAGTTVTFPSASATPYRIRLTVSRAGVPDLIEDIDITRASTTVPVTNAIASHPANQVTVPGGSASFSVTTTGAGPFVYQWRLNGVAYWGSSTSPALNLSNLGSGAIGSYDCVVSTPDGTLVSNAATLTFNATLARTPGGLRREIWNVSYGSAVGDLTGNSSFPLFPSITTIVNSAETTSYGDNYGQKLSGWIKPPVSGAYRFFIASDDSSQLWLSTDDTAANKVKVADFTGTTGTRSYSTGAQSAFINLVAGRKYYIEMIHKEAGGGDHLSVAWQMPGEPVPANGSEPIPGVYLEYEQYLPLLTNHWKLDETSGAACTDSVGTATATLYNNPARIADGVIGRAVSFNGVNQYAQATLNVSESVSAVSLWFRSTQASGGLYSVVDGGSGFDRCIFLTGGNIGSYIWSTETITSTGQTYNDGQWHHVVHTFGGAIGGQKLYVDGVQVAAGGKAKSDFTGQTTVKIGFAANAASPYFNGQIDDVRIYNAGLSIDDAAALYGDGINAAPQFSPAEFTVVENSPAGSHIGTLAATDANAVQTIAYSIVGGNIGGHFALDTATGALTVASPVDYETSDTYVLTVTATDSGTPARSVSTTATIAVANVNEAPVFVSNPVIGQPGAPGVAYTGNLNAVDPEAAGAVTYLKVNGPSWLVVASNGTLSGTPSAGDVGTNNFTVRATDSTSQGADWVLQIKVVDVAVNPIWINAAGGSWPVAGNWLSNGIANGQSIVADFSTLDLTADAAVTLNGSRTIGGLKFGDTTPSHNWTLNTGSAGPLTLNAAGTPVVNVSNQTATLNTALAGTKGLLKSGPGTLALGAASSYSGTTTISQGRLQLNVGNALPNTANIVIGDANSGGTAPNLYLGNQLAPTFATLTVGSGVANAALHTSGWAPTVSGITTLNSPLTIRQYNGGYVHTGIQNNGRITGPGAGSGNDTLIFNYGGSQNFYWQAGNTVPNDFAGNIRITGLPGNMNAQGGANGPNNVVIPDAAMVTIDAGCNFVWNNFGNNAVTETFDGLAGAGNMIRNNSGGLITSLNLTINANNGANEGDRVFTGALSSLNSFTFGGTGTQVFGGANNYTGPTTINGGKLLINGSLANTPTTVNAAGTLGGSGSIAGTVTNNGTLAPGNNGAGNLTVTNALTLAGGSHIAWQIANWTGLAGTGWDKITANSLDITATAGSPITIHLTEVNLANFVENSPTFILVQTTSGITGFEAAKFVIDDSALPTPQGTWSVDQNGNNLVLVYTPPNRAPSFASDPLSATAGVNLGITSQLEATDPDAGDSLTFTKLSGPAWLTVNANGTLSGTPAAIGTESFTVRVTDSHGLFDTAALEINVVDASAAPIWNNAVGGSWPVAGNWIGNNVADGNTEVADFTRINLTAVSAVTLDGARTIGGLKFGDTTPSHNWILNTGTPAGSLTLAVGSGVPVVTVNNQAAMLNVVLAGSQGLAKTGPGTLALGGANTYTGTTAVGGGTLLVQGPAVTTYAVTSASTTVASGATYKYDFSRGVLSGGFTHTNLKAVTVGSGGTLELYSTLVSGGNGASLLDNGTIISGSGTLNKTGVGEVDFWTTAGALTNFTGPINVQQGTLNFQLPAAADASGQSALNVSEGATADIRTGTLRIDALLGSGTVGCSYNGASIGSPNVLTIGNNNGGGTFTGVIRDGSATLPVTKNGAGTQIFSGANSYTGPTTINGGTLLINGSQGTSPTTVAAAGSLGGTGSIAGTVANNGTLVPGSNGTGNLTVTNTLTLAPGSKLVWEIANWTGAAGTGFDKLTANSLNLTATSVNPIAIRLVELALANFTETSKTFTLVETTSGITGFSANKFTLDTAGLTTPHGTWAVQQAGNNLVLAYTAGNPDANGNGIFDSWETARFGNANVGSNLANNDADKDGLVNLMEYALDTNPLGHSAGPVVDYLTIGTGKHLRITVNKNPQATNLAYIVETCGALSDWSSANTEIVSESATQLIVRDTFNTATSPRRFIRLRVQVVP